MTDPVQPPVLAFEGVEISLKLRPGKAVIIPDLTFSIRPGEALGLVGESGCGKSTVALAAMHYLGPPGTVSAGRILFEGRDIALMSSAELRAIRGKRIAMVYQDPMSSLNPVKTIGDQLIEIPMTHDRVDRDTAIKIALKMLEEVRLPDASDMMSRYPHQLSGGQQQRVVIAMALICQPSLLIMDEPTTGLDVTIEAAVLELVRELRRKYNTAILFISHNLGTVRRVCDRIGVMYAGELQEYGTADAIFRNPVHPYSRALLQCMPAAGQGKNHRSLQTIGGFVPSPLNRPKGCSFASRCPHALDPICTSSPIALHSVEPSSNHAVRCARIDQLPPMHVLTGDRGLTERRPSVDRILTISDLEKVYGQTSSLFSKARHVHALNQVSLAVEKGATLAIVGESGSGKSTLAKVLAGLVTATAGSIRLDADEISGMRVDRRPMGMLRKLQMVFQNPESTLNPSHRVGRIIARAVRKLRGLRGEALSAEVARLLEIVQLPQDFADRSPHQLSGGQKQRVAIARALAGEPTLILADEPVSALDVSVQAAIINLLVEIQERSSASLLLISHDLGMVRYMADTVAVMYLGQIVHFGPTETVFQAPMHPYTEALLSATPSITPNETTPPIILSGPIPSTAEKIQGCAFKTRCPRRVGPICDIETPPVRQLPDQGFIRCHIPLSLLLNAQLTGNAPASQPHTQARIVVE